MCVLSAKAQVKDNDQLYFHWLKCFTLKSLLASPAHLFFFDWGPVIQYPLYIRSIEIAEIVGNDDTTVKLLPLYVLRSWEVIVSPTGIL